MTDRKWTPEQEKVITLRDRDLLVSAAAGSGKTAVLIERILSRITDKDHPVDIDKILVVTFTRAAAGEMKERLYKGITDRMTETGDQKALSRQLVLLANARICTIDSFCINLLREHFEMLSIDPDFRMADDGELKLLSASVWEEILEDEYNRADDEFIRLTDIFSKKGRDDNLITILESIYKEAMSYPWPLKWLDDMCRVVDPEDGDFEKMPWLSAYYEYAKKMLLGIRSELEELTDEVHGTISDHPYLTTLSSDLIVINNLLATENFKELAGRASICSFDKLSTKRSTVDDSDVRENWKERRTSIKADTEALCKKINIQPYETVSDSFLYTRGITAEMVRLIKRFIKLFDEEKKRRGIMDFSDAEHLTLKLIVNEDGSDGPAAAVLKDMFTEVMVDEYQDTNELQEHILKGISGKASYFMVGDIKQSIYRFRQAKPEIFAGKYETFTAEPSDKQRIDLSYNFRSKSAIIDTVNHVFENVMHRDMGNVEYDDAARLALCIDNPSTDEERTEICVINKDDPFFAQEHINDVEAEGLYISRRINDLIRNYRIKDKDSDKDRELRYGDIAILNRGANKNGDRLCEILSDHGIPAHTASSVGYFESIEVKSVLALLSLIVNPDRDIEMACVLKSPLVGSSDEELVMIRADYPDIRFFAAVKEYASSEKASTKIKEFWDFLSEMRSLMYDTPVHAILSMIYSRSSYPDHVRTSKKGASKKANLEALYDMALQYEKTSYSGLASFIGYIEKQRTYEIDQASSKIMETENAVHIMTIHKSKGLEYPVVIISGMGKQMNVMDQRGEVLIHPAYGLGIRTGKFDGRARLDNLHRKAISHFIEMDDKGEELRVLYVAMTRARNKLIMVGCAAQKTYDRYEMMLTQNTKVNTSFRSRIGAKCYLDWVMPVIMSDQASYDIRLCDSAALMESDIKEISEDERILANVACKKILADMAGNELTDRIEEAVSFVYPHEVSNRYKNKYSVSDIKHEAILKNMEETSASVEEAELPMFLKKERPKVVPAFMGGISEEEENVGALRGVAMHRFLECFDFAMDEAASSYDPQIVSEMEKGLLTKDQRDLLVDDKLKTFLNSDLADRMMKAAKEGNLHKEHAFVMEHEMEPGVNVLVQGIIDAFFIEGKEAVLIDYKTDRVKNDKELADRYRMQAMLYKEAIEKAMGIRVKESYLYSFALGKAVAV